MSASAVPVNTPCPMCRVVGQLTLLSTSVNVPYFGDALETTMRCGACGFRHADFMILGQKDPLRLTLHANGEEDLTIRVIRSNSGTIRIPEMGFTAEPSPLSESYVSNVEGVLDRAKDVLLTALEFHGEDPEKVALLQEYLMRYEKMLAGEIPFTLIIDDPFGNSAILAEKVERRALTQEEVDSLRTGVIILDQGDLTTR
ncbi:MAG: zinc finger protein [Thermoplasmata archaeon]|nr:zinc finger protein [Thermoplasmata archaeon]